MWQRLEFTILNNFLKYVIKYIGSNPISSSFTGW
jgi:hypothetical protein